MTTVPPTSVSEPTRSMPPVIFLGALAALGPLAVSIHTQSIPEIARSFATPYGMALNTISAFLLAFAIAQLVVGPLSDRFGRKPVLYGGLILFGLASAGAAMADSIEMLILARVFQAAGGCATLITPRAVIQDTHRGIEAARIMALVAMLQSVAPAIGPVIGGGVDSQFGWRAIFWFLAILTGFLLLGTGIWMRETRPLVGGVPDRWSTIFLRYAGLFRSRLYLGYTVVFTFGTTGFFGYLAVGPALLIEQQGVSPFVFSLTLMVIATQFVTGNFTASRVVRHLGINRTLLIGVLGVTGAPVLLLILSDMQGIAPLVVPVVIFAFFNGFIFPNAMAGAVGVDPRVAGSAASFLGFAQLGTGAVISFGLSSLGTASPVPLALTLIGLGIMAGLGLLLVRSATPPA
jgi:DHA1 family bicyclomycin/chloramphenicol resistance-like MFS transporter